MANEHGQVKVVADEIAAETKSGIVVATLGNQIELRKIPPEQLREQDVNAHVMPAGKFQRLVANIKVRGSLESVPYCAQPNRTGYVEIVSGHHRIRAAVAAGLAEIHVLVDVSAQTRSQIIARQLAHNALVGFDDIDVLKQLVSMIDSADDLLATGLPPELLQLPDHSAMTLFTPRIDFEWRTITFAFLPHQHEEIRALIDATQGNQDLVIAGLAEQFEAFVTAASEFARFKEIRSGGTVIATLTRIALQEVANGKSADTDTGPTTGGHTEAEEQEGSPVETDP